MEDIFQKISDYVDNNSDRLVKELQDFLRQPSISTENIGMEKCVEMLDVELSKLDMKVDILKIDNAFPAICACAKEENSNKKLLIYGHYDVQSPDPVDKWTYDPFSAEIFNGHIYARGATDDKGNLFANIKAAEVLRAIKGKVPDGLKFFFEGEEEVGSPNLEAYFTEYKDILSADASILCDRGIHESGRPQIYLGNKGICSVEIKAKRAKRDVHSGHAPLISNAIFDLIRLLNSMRNEFGEIVITDYLKNVNVPSQEEIKLLKEIPFDKEQFKKEYDIDKILCDDDNEVEILKKLLYTPTCNISGIKGGWAGERGKTIVPCESWVRLDMRLVKNQSIDESKEKISKFIKDSTYGDFQIRYVGKNEPYQISPNNKLVQLSIGLAKKVYNSTPVIWPLLDGSGPMCLFPKCLKTECFIIGLGAPFSTANTHAPDENISIDQYIKGIKLMANIYHQYLINEQ